MKNNHPDLFSALRKLPDRERQRILDEAFDYAFKKNNPRIEPMWFLVIGAILLLILGLLFGKPAP